MSTVFQTRHELVSPSPFTRLTCKQTRVCVRCDIVTDMSVFRSPGIRARVTFYIGTNDSEGSYDVSPSSGANCAVSLLVMSIKKHARKQEESPNV